MIEKASQSPRSINLKQPTKEIDKSIFIFQLSYKQ